ncbi:MAG: type I DNA topoisomerase [bacterium]|nr:type I DNA topoisomerase [bacterium]
MAKLLIVESPAKAKTINKYLGNDFIVKSSMGHIKDLPKTKLGVDVDNNFEPQYKVIKGREKLLKELKALAKKSKNVYLAPDPDREGEAIAWHLAQELGGDKINIFRVNFNEITKKAILQGVDNPGEINLNRVNAQQARRILDRLVGYKISPLLWKKVQKGLSAGRVQSVAVRLICEREVEIEKFVAQEYWTITISVLPSSGKEAEKFEAELYKINGKKSELAKQDEVTPIVEELKKETYIIEDINIKEKKKNSPAPFITSSLQQEAFRRFGFSAKKTMLFAQNLYEGLEIGEQGPVGLITYMRTDSIRVSPEAVKETVEFIKEKFGNEYVLTEIIKRKEKANVQDAHEAIRPTSCRFIPDEIKQYLSQDQYKIYKLIWERFVASQMSPAIYDQTTVTIKAGRFLFRATGLVEKFKGFTVLYEEKKDESEEDKTGRLPVLTKNELLKLLDVKPGQHFTKPPSRYTEATLIKELEDKGIGRPSTYASIVGTVQDRGYVGKEEKRLFPAELGKIVNGLLVTSFPDVVEVAFTANMESNLDKIEEGEVPWQKVLEEFYKVFVNNLNKAEDTMRNVKKEQEKVTDIVCEKCGGTMVVKWGRRGKFLACSNFPACRNAKPWDEKNETVAKEEVSLEVCQNCGKPMVVKVGRFGKFLACSNYPECKTTKPILQEIGMNCPEAGCSGKIIQRRSGKGRMFFGCSKYPACKFVSWDKPVAKPCPVCGAAYILEKFNKSGNISRCSNPDCTWTEKSGV